MHELLVCITQEHEADCVERIVLHHGLHLDPLPGVEASPVKVECDQREPGSKISPSHLLYAGCGDYRTPLFDADKMLQANLQLLKPESKAVTQPCA